MLYSIYRITIDWRLIDLDNSTPLTEALFYILLAARKPNHGYGIIQDVCEMTDGRVTLGPGTLYGAINSMLAKEWISLYSEDKESRKKKEYLITSTGRQVFQNEVKRLNELIRNAKMMDD
jgi:DNA-binding PadR family transcriptional regulator